MKGTKRNIRFEELDSQRSFAVAELQVRADGNPLTEGRKQYRVWLDDQEAAYLSFDTFWEDQLNLYEVFVAEAVRNQGVGTEIIHFAAKLGRQMDKPRLTVLPEPLSEQPKGDLIGWYMRRGFKVAPDNSELLEIVLI